MNKLNVIFTSFFNFLKKQFPMFFIACFVVIALYIFNEGVSDENDFLFIFFISFCLYLLFASIAAIGNRIFAYRKIKNDTLHSKDSPERIEIYIRKKSQKLRQLNMALLLLIILSSVVGMYIFVSAEELARGEDAYKKASSQVSESYYELESIISKHERNIKKLATNLQAISGTNSEKPVNYNKAVIESYQAEVDSLKDSINIHKEGRDILATSLKNIQLTQSSNLVFFSTITNKIGSILILLFFVRIIVNLYRYNARLATFYESRADAIGLATELSSLKYQDFIDSLFPTSFDFDKNPTPPAQEIGNIFKNALDKALSSKTSKEHA